MKKKELLEKIKEVKSIDKLNEIRSEIENLEEISEEQKQNLNSEELKEEISNDEERNLIRNSEQQNEIEKRKFIKVEKKEDSEMKEQRTLSEILASKEYRSGWAKKLMGVKLDENEERALGDAVTTTATEYVQSEEMTQGINNAGLYIPTTVRTDMIEIIEQSSPFLRDVRKIYVASNVEMPYLNAADDAKWYSEIKETENEGQKYETLKLTSHELAKQVVITWKLEKMSVDAFIDFITKELAYKMGRALATASIYGTGENEPTGALNDVEAIEGEEVIQAMINTYASLPDEMKVNAKAYLSSALAIQVVGYKDNNGNYPYLQGLKSTALFDIEVDPFLKAEDILVGNPQNYILNTIENISVNRETKVTQRRNIYSTYAQYDGKPYPKAFAKGAVKKN